MLLAIVLMAALQLEQFNSPVLDSKTHTSLASCYAAIPASGGPCIIPSGYKETLEKALVMNKSGAGFWCLGSCVIVGHVIVPAGTYGAFLKGMTPYGGNGNVDGFHIVSTDAGNAVRIGSSSGLTTREFSIENVTVTLSRNPGAIGIYLQNTVYFHLNDVAVTGTSAKNQTGIVLDGAGNFCGTGTISNPLLSGLAVGIKGVGTGANAMNAVTVSGGTISTNKTGTGIDIEGGSSNTIINTDLESNAVAVRFGQNAYENLAQLRSEANAVEVQADKGSKRNVACFFKSGFKMTILDKGTDNHFGTCSDGEFTKRLLVH